MATSFRLAPSPVGFDYVGRKRRLSSLHKLVHKHPEMYTSIHILGAFLGKRLVASITYDSSKKDLFLMDVFVLKSERRQGIFQAMLKEIKKQFPRHRLDACCIESVVRRELNQA